MRIYEPSSGVASVESDYGVNVHWNNVHNARVTVFGRHLNKTSGLCGKFNGYAGDDFQMRDGRTADNAVYFGNSWKTDPLCDNATSVRNPCETYPERNFTATANCSALLYAPFNACRIDAISEGYIRDCEYDVCACRDDSPVCLCQAIDAYVSDCNATGVNIDWLNDHRYQHCGMWHLFVNAVFTPLLHTKYPHD